MVRRFVIVGHRAITSSKFALNDLCGATGRLDVLLRCVNSAFFLSHGLRRDVEAYLVLQGEPSPPKTIRIVGSEVKYLNPDERSTAALIKKALENYRGRGEERSTPGIYISQRSFDKIVGELANQGPIICLNVDGRDVHETGLDEDVTFVLGDSIELDEREQKVLEDLGAEKITLGPLELHADHCITIVHNILDRQQK